MRGLGWAAVITASLLAVGAARAEISDGKVKIGVLTDLSGPYEQNSGNGSVEAAKMAAEEFGNTVNGKPIEIVSAEGGCTALK
jgi:branched-chain amino acid transport system substrate-binding protein